MKYYLDTEFIEGFHKPFLGKRRHFIDLISIGIICEDGREYYAISNEFNPKDASDWVKKKVISKLPYRYVDFYDSPSAKHDALLYKSNTRIKHELLEFFGYNTERPHYGSNDSGIEIYAYYADYDWVLLCSLFGTMMDLPKGFPMYCRDLKQMFDECATLLTSEEATAINYPSVTHDVYEFLEKTTNGQYKINVLKKHKSYPQQTDEHNAISDARWNRNLHNFIEFIKGSKLTPSSHEKAN